MPEPDYRQSDVTGKKWRRSCHGEFDNAFGKVPWIRFDWEDRISYSSASVWHSFATGTISTRSKGSISRAVRASPFYSRFACLFAIMSTIRKTKSVAAMSG
jgi:hypothetical protein